jgi:thioredoxin reductase
MVDAAKEKNKLTVLLKSVVTKINENSVELDCDGEQLEMANDVVIVCAGGTLPTPFLKEIGVMVKTHHGTKVG